MFSYCATIILVSDADQLSTLELQYEVVAWEYMESCYEFEVWQWRGQVVILVFTIPNLKCPVADLGGQWVKAPPPSMQS